MKDIQKDHTQTLELKNDSNRNVSGNLVAGLTAGMQETEEKIRN